MKRLIGTVLLALVLGGCFGRPGPVEEYLKVASGQRCEGRQAGVKTVPVGIKRFTCLDAMDRQAVMLAKGRVMTPSLRWYWEASPASLTEQAVAAAVNCSRGMAAVWPVRAASVTEYTVSGRVVSFLVREDVKAVEASLELQLWDKDGKPVGALDMVSVSEPVSVIDGPAIADAGARVLASLSDKAVAWIEAAAAIGSAK